MAIVGNDNATQPLSWIINNRRFYLVHNGEIYNYNDLKSSLIEDGDCEEEDFKTEGDSEVLLACLAHRGINWTLDHIKGMFAFVFVESSITPQEGECVNKLIMSRDVFGIKPLCYAFDEKQENLFICSEVQAIPHDIGLTSIRDVLSSSYIEISIQTSNGSPSWSTCEHKYGSLGSTKFLMNNETSLSHNQRLSEIRLRLIEAVSIRIPGDRVSFAVLLSGGLDSSLICRLAADLIYPQKLHTFTITSSNDEEDGHAVLNSDCYFAQLVAEQASNIIHHQVSFTFEDGMKVLPEVVRCTETADPAIIRASVPLYLLSKHISSQGFKVILCGEGADETMAGYRLFESFTITETDLFTQELNRRLFNIDTSELQRVDRCTSAHGLEARVPFLDINFVAAVMNTNTEEVRMLITCSCHSTI